MTFSAGRRVTSCLNAPYLMEDEVSQSLRLRWLCDDNETRHTRMFNYLAGEPTAAMDVFSSCDETEVMSAFLSSSRKLRCAVVSEVAPSFRDIDRSLRSLAGSVDRLRRRREGGHAGDTDLGMSTSSSDDVLDDRRSKRSWRFTLS